jgi:ketosteroid isomerase-like protein
MRKVTAIAVLSLLAAAAYAAASLSLLQNEYAFARDVAKHGVRDGFLVYLDKQAITFAPTPVNAYDFYTQRKPGSSKLSWYPVFALVSGDGGFGVDTGPWTADYVQDGKPQQAHGEWLTVWARDPSGAWHALFDAGIGHTKPDPPVKELAEDATVAQLSVASGPVPTADAVHDQLTGAEAAFSAAAAQGLRSAYEQSATGEIHLLLDNTQPLVGRDVVLKAIPAAPAGLEWVPMGSGAAKSGDLGYVYGMTYKSADTKRATPQGVYMHVWRRDLDGWKLLIAEESPLPQSSK